MKPDSSSRSSRDDDFFKKEISSSDITKAAHYTYRDGFRLGLGIFIGFLAGTVVIIAVTYLFNFIVGLF
ncbi:MAG TPA: hypothetical protein PJ993_00610 [Candidatus Saccharibacteria bacterium]|nr:hypothetical protein [Candidatus Saccharibacteria bacterium]HMT39427.1 hypothetical protein [Candidatus Saccharibacteria bacterium]